MLKKSNSLLAANLDSDRLGRGKRKRGEETIFCFFARGPIVERLAGFFFLISLAINDGLIFGVTHDLLSFLLLFFLASATCPIQRVEKKRVFRNKAAPD